MAERITERKEWQGYIKNANQEIETVDLTSTTYQPSVDKGDFIRQAKPTQVRPTRRKRPTRADSVTLAFGSFDSFVCFEA